MKSESSRTCVVSKMRVLSAIRFPAKGATRGARALDCTGPPALASHLPSCGESAANQVEPTASEERVVTRGDMILDNSPAAAL